MISVDWTPLLGSHSHLCFHQFIPPREEGTGHNRDQCVPFSFEQHKNFNWGPGVLGGSSLLFPRASAGWLAHHRAKGVLLNLLREGEAAGLGPVLHLLFPVIRARCSRSATWPTCLRQPRPCLLPASCMGTGGGTGAGHGTLKHALADRSCDYQRLPILFLHPLLQLNFKIIFYFIRDGILLISLNPFFIENTEVDFHIEPSQTTKNATVCGVSLSQSLVWSPGQSVWKHQALKLNRATPCSPELKIAEQRRVNNNVRGQLPTRNNYLLMYQPGS